MRSMLKGSNLDSLLVLSIVESREKRLEVGDWGGEEVRSGWEEMAGENYLNWNGMRTEGISGSGRLLRKCERQDNLIQI